MFRNEGERKQRIEFQPDDEQISNASMHRNYTCSRSSLRSNPVIIALESFLIISHVRLQAPGITHRVLIWIETCGSPNISVAII